MIGDSVAWMDLLAPVREPTSSVLNDTRAAIPLIEEPGVRDKDSR